MKTCGMLLNKGRKENAYIRTCSCSGFPTPHISHSFIGAANLACLREVLKYDLGEPRHFSVAEISNGNKFIVLEDLQALGALLAFTARGAVLMRRAASIVQEEVFRKRNITEGARLPSIPAARACVKFRAIGVHEAADAMQGQTFGACLSCGNVEGETSRTWVETSSTCSSKARSAYNAVGLTMSSLVVPREEAIAPLAPNAICTDTDDGHRNCRKEMVR